MTPLLLDSSSLALFAEVRAAQAKRNADPHLCGDERESTIRIEDGVTRTVVKLPDGTAILPITAVIDYRPSWLSYYGYYVSSLQLHQAFHALLADELVSRIVFDIDSPGGVYSGVPELARDIFASRGQKTTIAVANPCAASGAVWIGAAAEKFVVLGSGQAGSVGCLMVHSDWSQYFLANGVTNTILRSPEGKADFNHLEPLSEASRAHHQAQIEAIADEFLAAMAKFRGVSKKVAADQFGQGRMLDAKAAIAAGLVDGAVDSLDAVVGGKGTRKRVRLNPRLQLARLRSLGASESSPPSSP